MGLHTESGCTQVSPVQSSTLINSTDCDYNTNSNEGCIVTNPTTKSYGADFASAGGGVFITEFAEDGISYVNSWNRRIFWSDVVFCRIWFYSRSDIPSAITSNSSSIDTSDFGTPVANWPSGGCTVDTFFEAQNLIFDITLCGDFAGATSVFSETCTGVCYNDWVIGDASAYDNAYFDVASVRVFSKTGSDTVVKGSSGALGRVANAWKSMTAIVFGVAIGTAVALAL